MIAVALMKMDVAVVIPNWNGKDRIGACLDSVLAQSVKPIVIVVENGSTDGSLEFLRKNYPEVLIVVNKNNLGFAGGVNSGIHRARELNVEFVALLNNDAVINKQWVRFLKETLRANKKLAAASSKILSNDEKHLDNTGDAYSIWGLAFPRQRDVLIGDAVNEPGLVFGACAGASMYRLQALYDVGLFDEDFFAYYEDSDLNFRLQLAGWKAAYDPKAVTRHATGSTGGRIKGFHTYQTLKNLPLLFWKNVPTQLLPKMLPRFTLVYASIVLSSVANGRGWPASKGFLRMLTLLPKKLLERQHIQKKRKVSVDYIDSILVHDLPPNAEKLRKLRAFLAPGRGNG